MIEIIVIFHCFQRNYCIQEIILNNYSVIECMFEKAFFYEWISRISKQIFFFIWGSNVSLVMFNSFILNCNSFDLIYYFDHIEYENFWMFSVNMKFEMILGVVYHENPIVDVWHRQFSGHVTGTSHLIFQLKCIYVFDFVCYMHGKSIFTVIQCRSIHTTIYVYAIHNDDR